MKNLYIIIFLLTLFGCKKSDDGTVEVIPLAPTELKGTIISKDQVDLTWKDNSTNETGYKIERKTDSGNFTEIGSTAADVTIFSDKTVSLNTNYTYRVYSFNKVGKSINYSNEVSIKTINLPTLTTFQISSIYYQGASSGGQITSDGGSAITANGVVWDTSTNPTIALSTKTTELISGSFKSSITGLKATTKYYVRAYATNAAGTGYGNELSFTTDAYVVPPTLTTNTITDILFNGANSGGNISADGGAAVTARGVVWDTSTNPRTDLSTKTSDGTGTGSFKSSITGLKANTKYYVRAYAINSNWIGYGNEISFTTPAATSFTFNTVVGANKRIWMDRNLGASRVATSSTDAESYGDYYQWGRGADGHQLRTSATITTLSSADQPGNGRFILAPNTTISDWRSPQNDNLWQGVNGVNNPCPPGYRIPTEAEWDAERLSWSTNNAAGALASPLKLPMAGGRKASDGSLYNVGSTGTYWRSTVSTTSSVTLIFGSSYAGMNSTNRASGLSVRCIKD
jgi:uncharacterized protein (TIGR02145 family)